MTHTGIASRQAAIASFGAVVALFTTTACTSSDGDDWDHDPDDLYTTYMGNIDASADVQHGLEQLAGVCLRELGVRSNYIPEPMPVDEDAEPNDYLMGLRDRVSVEEAEELGYAEWVPGLFAISPHSPDETEAEFQESSAQQLVLNVMRDGSLAQSFLTGADFNNAAVAEAGFDLSELEEFLDQHAEGCTGAAKDVVFEDDREDWEEHVALAARGLHTDNHAEFNAIQNEWLDCMADNGYSEATDYYYFHELQSEHMNDNMPTEEFDEKQRELAISDAECSEELNVNERNRDIADEILLNLAQEDEAAFFEFQDRAAEFSIRIQGHIRDDAVLNQ